MRAITNSRGRREIAVVISSTTPSAELDPLRLRDHGIALRQLALDLDRAAYRIDDARKFDQQPVASRFDNAAAMLISARKGNATEKRAYYARQR